VRTELATDHFSHYGQAALPGVHRTYHNTVLIFPAREPADHSYGTTGWGAAPLAGRPGRAMAADDVHRLTDYLIAHPEVTGVQLTGADPLTMGAPALRRFVEPLLALEQLESIQIDTSALACWPYRFLTDPDADDTLRLFEQIAGPVRGPGAISRAARRSAQVLQQFRLSRQHPGKDLAGNRQQLRHMRTGEGVVHGGTLLARDHQIRPAQHRQLLRQMRRLDTDLGQHLRHRMLAFAQQLQHTDAGGMPQRFEELRLQLVQRHAHRSTLPIVDTQHRIVQPAGLTRPPTPPTIARPTVAIDLSNCQP
jgi:hypothetical protein